MTQPYSNEVLDDVLKACIWYYDEFKGDFYSGNIAGREGVEPDIESVKRKLDFIANLDREILEMGLGSDNIHYYRPGPKAKQIIQDGGFEKYFEKKNQKENLSPGNKFIEKLKANKFLSILIAGGTIVIGLATFSEAFNKLSQPFKEKEEDIIVDVTLASYLDPKVTGIITDTFGLIKYYQTKSSDTILIKSKCDYANNFFNDRLILVPEIGYYEPPNFNVHFPILDIKVVNNSTKTIVLTEIAINVNSSRVDKRPFLYLVTFTDESFKLSLANEGWGKWDYCTIRFNLYPERSDLNSLNRDYKHSIRMDYFENWKKLNLEQWLNTEGLDIEFLKNAVEQKISPNETSLPEFERALGNFRYNSDGVYYAIMVGELEIQHNNYKVKFIAKIPLTLPEGLGGGLQVFDSYDIKLKDSGDQYTITYPVSMSLKPNEPERLFLSLKADKSTFHTFKVNLNNINKTQIESKPVKLELFLPKISKESFKK